MTEPDRRLVLHGLAASLLVSLTGCPTRVREGVDDLRPDAGEPPPMSILGFEKCDGEVCILLADEANAALRAVGGSRVILVGQQRFLVIRIERMSFLVLSARCTHNGCTVRYAAERSEIQCPCHGSRFALSGAVTKGPAAAPLATYMSTYDPVTDVVRVNIG